MERLREAVCFKQRPSRPETVLQFGEGGFLRAFADEMLDTLQREGLYGGDIVVVQPLRDGLTDILNEQDGLYTLLLRGLEDGVPVTRERVVASVRRGINPYADYEGFLTCARNPDLRFVISNTTEAGIAYNPGDKPDHKPPDSFPGKVTVFLYARFTHFGGDPAKGLVFLPCELIDGNGAALREIVMRLAGEWGFGGAFTDWITQSCVFTSTLVDRIVTGYPKDEAAELCARLGYEDRLLDTGELFHFWAIEGPEGLAAELPFDKAGLNVVFTNDAAPYKKRKVRILNGAHTALVPAGLLCGLETVGQCMEDRGLRRYLEGLLYDEVIPSLERDLAREDLLCFTKSVFDRFGNPYIRHMLTSIALNTTSKWKARVLPSVEEYLALKGRLPKLLTFSFAASLALAAQGRPDVRDSDDLAALYNELKTLPGFEDETERALADIRQNGCRAALERRL